MVIPAADADADVASAPSCWESGCCIAIGIVRLLMMTMLLLLLKGRNNISRMRIDLVGGDVAQGHTVAVAFVAAAVASGRKHVTRKFIGGILLVRLAFLDDQCLLVVVIVKMSLCPVGTGQLPGPPPFLSLSLVQKLFLPPPIASFHGGLI